MPMRYYEYLSAAKVDMLYPQIDQTSRSAGGEVGFDLKVIKASRKTDGKKEPTIYEKLAAVEDWIYAHEPVGSMDEPAPWISGRLDLVESIVSESVLFAARNKTLSYLLMGGSAAHLDQARAPADLPRMRPRSSGTDQIFSALQRFAANTKEIDSAKGSGSFHARTGSYAVTTVVQGIDLMFRQPLYPRVQHCEFLAKRLQTITIDEATVTLATPLFVALAD